MNSIKSVIPTKIKRYLKVDQYILGFQQKKKESNQRKVFERYLNEINGNKKVLILDACDHRNLGDQAILMAELQYLKDHFKGYEIVTVGLGKFDDYIKLVREHVGLNDILVLHGGGNLGNEYKRAESTRRTIIEMFPSNKIILFPQTMYFSNNLEGEHELLKSKNIYSKHKDLILIAREQTSFYLMKKNFGNNTVLITPDIVLYLNKSMPQKMRSGALLCCRKDIEGMLSEKDKLDIYNLLREKFTNVSLTDTIGENNFEGVERKFDEFKNAEIVITDRLHGMVFAAITGTPCIALSNYNYKVSGTYEWIKHLQYIKYTDNIEHIPKLISELQNLKETTYDNKFAFPHFKQIIDVL